mmetsp:Transcript_17565/g.26886  ORF Transcript_17565/g.26886 Transcript_17565/m.26886 type:complete len:226 (-) Transcript_17565:194-871(-)
MQRSNNIGDTNTNNNNNQGCLSLYLLRTQQGSKGQLFGSHQTQGTQSRLLRLSQRHHSTLPRHGTMEATGFHRTHPQTRIRIRRTQRHVGRKHYPRRGTGRRRGDLQGQRNQDTLQPSLRRNQARNGRGGGGFFARFGNQCSDSTRHSGPRRQGSIGTLSRGWGKTNRAGRGQTGQEKGPPRRGRRRCHGSGERWNETQETTTTKRRRRGTKETTPRRCKRYHCT